MQLSALQAQLQALGYGTDTAAVQILFLNDAYRSILGGQRWPFLEKQNSSLTITLGTPTVSFASITDLVEFDAVRLTDAAGNTYDLDNCPPQEMRDLEVFDNKNVATPQRWSIIANSLHFWPYPDKTYTLNIDYIFQPPDLAAPTDVPVFPSTFHDTVVWGAAKLIAIRERDVYTQSLVTNEYETRLRRMKEAYLLRQRQTSSRVKQSGIWNAQRPYPWTFW